MGNILDAILAALSFIAMRSLRIHVRLVLWTPYRTLYSHLDFSDRYKGC